MTKNGKTVLLASLGALVLLVISVGIWDLCKGRQRCFDCSDGQRCTMDLRQFATQYSAYSVELEASVKNQTTFATRIKPVQLQQLSEALQSGNEFRKYVVAGFNSCAITKAQYGQLGPRFQALDNLAHEINSLATKAQLTQDESARLETLISQYADLARRLGAE